MSSFTPDQLQVIAVISNPRRFESRYNLYRHFEQYVHDSGATLWTVEAAYGERNHEVTSHDNHRHIRVRNSHELWQKEAMMNIALARIPKEYRYIATIDADVEFERKDWAIEAVEQLQHHPVVQLWSHCVDLGPNHEAIQVHSGFAYCYKHGKKIGKEYSPFLHPGFAWAYRRGALDRVGGFFDKAILGSGDHHMATALVGKTEMSIHQGATESYKKAVHLWQSHAKYAFENGNIGYIPGLIRHRFHGNKASRKYVERWQILIDEKFDPETDILKDCQGLWQLSGNKPGLRDKIMAYHAMRNEDSIDAPAFFI